MICIWVKCVAEHKILIYTELAFIGGNSATESR